MKLHVTGSPKRNAVHDLRPLELTPEEFAEAFLHAPETPAKEEATFLYPVVFGRECPPGGCGLGGCSGGPHAVSANVTSRDILPIDLDHLTTEQRDGYVDAIERLGLEYAAYETYSDNPDKDDRRLRVLVPLATPFDDTKWSWSETAKALFVHLGIPPGEKGPPRTPGYDKACLDARHGFYGPSRPPGQERAGWHAPGRRLDWASVVPEPTPRHTRIRHASVTGSDALTPEDEALLRKRLTDVPAAANLLAGLPLGRHGEGRREAWKRALYAVSKACSAAWDSEAVLASIGTRSHEAELALDPDAPHPPEALVDLLTWYREETMTSHIADVHEGLKGSRVEVPPSDGPPEPTSGPRYKIPIELGNDNHDNESRVIAGLAMQAAPVYVRAGRLVDVLRYQRPGNATPGRGRAEDTPVVRELNLAGLRSRITECLSFVRQGKPTGCPDALVLGVLSRHVYPGLRPLRAVVEIPTLRPDLTLLDRPGYDEATGLLLWPSGPLPELPEPTREAGEAAVGRLLDVVRDFEFAGPEHRSAWLAGLLTVVCRPALSHAPLFLIDAPLSGSGKTLLADLIAVVATGRPATKHTMPTTEEEQEKVLLTLTLEGDAVVLFDNLPNGGVLGSAVLDKVLSAGSIKGRILGKSQSSGVLPVNATLLATGNNVSLGGDILRRLCRARLVPTMERPTERRGFQHANLIRWAAEHRWELLTDALTAVRAYVAAGATGHAWDPWGTPFDDFDAVVRGGLAWYGLADPKLGTADIATDEHDEVDLFELIEQADPQGRGLRTRDIVGAVNQASHIYAVCQALRELSPRPDDVLSAKSAGRLLLARRDKVVNGRRLTMHTVANYQVWKIRRV